MYEATQTLTYLSILWNLVNYFTHAKSTSTFPELPKCRSNIASGSPTGGMFKKPKNVHSQLYIQHLLQGQQMQQRCILGKVSDELPQAFRAVHSIHTALLPRTLLSLIILAGFHLAPAVCYPLCCRLPSARKFQCTGPFKQLQQCTSTNSGAVIQPPETRSKPAYRH